MIGVISAGIIGIFAYFFKKYRRENILIKRMDKLIEQKQYLDVLKIYDDLIKDDSVNLSLIEYRVAYCYSVLSIHSENEELLLKAIAYHKRNLEKRKDNGVFDHISYASTLLSLGLAYRRLADIRNKNENFEIAYDFLCRASMHIDKNKHNKEFYILHRTAGDIFCERANINNAEDNLLSAENHYTIALEANYANSTTYNSIGIVYRMLSEINNKEDNINRALDAFNRALKNLTIESNPDEYANVSMNLGIAFKSKFQISNDISDINKSIDFYNLCLDIYQNNKQVLYAKALMNKGVSYLELNDFTNNINDLKTSISIFEDALRYFPIKDFPIDFANTKSNLGSAYIKLSELEDKEINKSNAIAAFKNALMVFTKESYPDKNKDISDTISKCFIN